MSATLAALRRFPDVGASAGLTGKCVLIDRAPASSRAPEPTVTTMVSTFSPWPGLCTSLKPAVPFPGYDQAYPGVLLDRNGCEDQEREREQHHERAREEEEEKAKLRTG